MKKLSKITVLGTALIISSSASALDMPDMSGYYYHLKYSMLSIDVSNVDGSGTADTSAVSVEIGTNVYEHDLADIYVEGVAILGLDDESAFATNGTRYVAGIDAGIGIQAKAHRQFNEKIAGFVNIGIMNTTVTVSKEAVTNGGWYPSEPVADNTETVTTYAFGAEYMLSQSSALTLSYSSLYGDDVGVSDVDVTGINLGYKASF